MGNFFTKFLYYQSEEQNKQKAPGPSKRKFSVSSVEESERGRKRLKCSIENQRRGRKHSRDSDDVEEPQRKKMAKTSSREPGRKRSRGTGEDEEQHTKKRVKTCPENVEGPVVDYSNTSFSQSLESYKFQKVLGQGNFGKVMLALHEKTNHLVAIKEIVKGSVPARSIHVEQHLLEMAKGCPFLSHGLTAFHDETNTYLVMEYVQGGSLHDFLDKKHLLNLDESRFIAAELICGIQFLHSRGVIHRDLKPENTLMSREGHVKITDFGLAVVNIVGRNKVMGQCGTLEYMSPEVLGDKRYGFAADWWSLGVMICQMITGQYPFKTTYTFKDYRRNVLTALPCYPEWLSTDARDLLYGLLNKHPKSRLEFARNIRKHAFFSDIDWKDLELCKVHPPYLVTT